MRNPIEMTRGRLGALVAGLTLAAAAPAAAMTGSLGPGWQAFLGCWEPVAAPMAAGPASSEHLVCIVPVEGTSAVEMITVAEGRIVERERVDANGARQAMRRDECSGWQSADWSTIGHRVFVRSELSCEGGLGRTSTGVISMTSATEWMDVQSVAVGEQRAVRVLRYREARPLALIPTEVTVALGARSFATSTARIAASAPVTLNDVVDVARNLDASGAEVWLLEQKLAFKADARNLVQLSAANVPDGVIDVVVAMSYPDRFAIDATQRQIAVLPGVPRVSGDYVRDRSPGGYYDPFMDPYRYSRGSRYYSPYGYSQYGYGYGYGGGYGWYPGQRPVIIIVKDPNAPDETQAGRGRAVNGRGYTRNRGSADSPPATRTTRSGDSGSSSSGSSGEGGSAGSSSTGSGSSGGSAGRTAKPRPPGGE